MEKCKTASRAIYWVIQEVNSIKGKQLAQSVGSSGCDFASLYFAYEYQTTVTSKNCFHQIHHQHLLSFKDQRKTLHPTNT
ncbi:Hypothetical predicted protein [Octopus vulgaris]|uniref:Uncharacterized protein n=1 Tax=Octopus vulgaris TaxID=6645 RepID=A0AA36C0B0_OCTVU|nr:Hypothetical predicted protein [Octopus vulgaris]